MWRRGGNINSWKYFLDGGCVAYADSYAYAYSNAATNECRTGNYIFCQPRICYRQQFVDIDLVGDERQ